MDESEREDFMAAVGADSYDDALFAAMCQVASPGPSRYFGRVSGGTFYADENPENTRWFPDTTPQEAIGSLDAEFGTNFVDGLEPALEE